MSEPGDAYLEALGSLPQAKAERLTHTKAIFEEWLKLLHALQNLDRYHLHESPDVAQLDLKAQGERALSEIHKMRHRIATLRLAHHEREEALAREKTLKATLKKERWA